MAPARPTTLGLRGRRPAPPLPTRGDLGVLAMLLGVHAVPVIGFGLHSAGWGQGAAAYGSAVVFLVARELVREVARRPGADRA